MDDSEHWQQVEALYHSALEVEAEEREDFVAVACAGDEALRREVLSLLSSAERADSFMEEPVMSVGLMLMNAEQEPLTGKSVGPYLLLSLLGRGGMGEVYLAHDPRLNRRVALKLLPAGVADEGARRRRFEQEARAASAISHPNVAHIYEIGEADGRRYIAMEYVRGRTLREALRRGPLGASDALDIAAQIADALADAHEAGVLHRDIKPENVVLRDDGYVKVLDFGLAKLLEDKLRADAPEAAPLPSLHTEPELMMGTSDYMSPEQVRRERADSRTDLWSLGVVLYEMLAGRRPFSGRGTREVIVAILEREPEPIERVTKGLPAELHEVVAKALRKSAAERFQSAREMADELRRVARLIEAGVSPSAQSSEKLGDGAAPPAAPSAGPSRPYGVLGRMAEFRASALNSTLASTLQRRWRPVYLLLFASLAAVGIYFGLAQQRRQSLHDRPLQLKFERLNLSGDISDIALSPDGKYVARVAAEDGKYAISITELATASDLRITQPSAAGYSGLSFSPDGTYLYYLENHAETGTLYRVSKLGGAQRKILDDVGTAVTFSPDGARLAFVRTNRALDTPDLVVAQADGAAERLLARRTRADSATFMADLKRAGPVWSPDGKVLACPTLSLAPDREMNLELIDADTGAGRRLNLKPWHDISSAAWLADGSALVVSAAAAPGAPWQLQLLAYPGGEVRKVTNDPNNYMLVSGARDSSLFIMLNAEEQSSVWQLSAAGAGQFDVAGVAEKKGVSEILWDGDGGFLYTVNDGIHTNLWAREEGAAERQLTFEADNFKPARSPDGRFVVFVSTRAGTMNLWRVNADGTQPVRLTDGKYEDVPSVTPDGRWVIYRTGNGIRKVSIEGGPPTVLFDKSALCPALSPDGRLLAFFTNDQPASQTWHVEVYDLAASAVVKRFELPAATTPFNGLRLTPDNRLRWTPDGSGLAYVSRADGASNVWLQPLAGGPPRQLTYFKDAVMPSFAWSPDGKRLACVRSSKAYVPVLVRLFE
ncbi:MAG TPA: protein kinase [Pyrinomonadaceae bacterium]|jgi:serine/threonine protein kinase|nr:protein kinase [Pyrinomonadaceae bacterium]